MKVRYNNLELGDDKFKLQRVTGIYEIPIRTSSEVLTGADGGNVWAQKYGMRTIGLEGVIIGDYKENARDLVQAFSITDTNLTLEIEDDEIRTIQAKVLQMPNIIYGLENVSFLPFRTSLICEDPFVNGIETLNYDIKLGEGEGFPLLAPLPMPLGGGTGELLAIDNEGSFETEPIYTFSGELTAFSLSNNTTGEQFSLNVIMGVGDTLIVKRDGTGLSIKLNGVDVSTAFTGSYFGLKVGANVLQFTSTSFSASANCNVSYKEKYLTF